MGGEAELFRYLRLPDFVTILNALFGLAAVFLILEDRTQALLASIFVLLGASMDALDGFLARKLKYGILGANLDSFADLITFGLAPAAVCYVLLSSVSAAICSALFSICGMLRLARFNILPKTEGFIGMPITAGGVFVALFVLSFKDSDLFNLIIPILAVLSYLMISRIPYPKIRDRRLVLLFGVIFILTLGGYYLNVKQLFQSSSYVLLGLVTLYILSPVRRFRYKK